MTKKHKESLPTKPPAAQPAVGEVVTVPKGTSRLRFLLMFLGAVFVLVVFAAGDYLPSLFSRSPASEVALSWERPGRGVERYTLPEYLQIRRTLEDFHRVQQRQRLDDEEVAYHIVTHALAVDAGIEVTRQEMGKAILQGAPGMTPFFSEQNYRARLQAAGVTRASFESMLREVMRVRRFELMLLSALALPDPEGLEESWKEQNQEHAFQGAYVELARLEKEAAAEAPGDEELQAWVDALPDRRARFAQHWGVDRYSAEVIGWREGLDDPTALIEAYPVTEETDVLDGRRFYDAFAHVRYQREQPLEPDPEDPDLDPRGRLYLPFEEVEERAEVDAKVFMAIDALIQDLRARAAAGEEVDYREVAERLGLHHELQPEPHTQAEWSGEGERRPSELANPFFAGGIAMSGVDGTPKRQILSPKGIFMARVPERVRAGLPPVAQMREDVVAAWAAERARARADERLRALREELVPSGTPRDENEITAERFLEAAQAQGLGVATVDWLDPRRLANEEEEGLEPMRRLLRAQQLAGGDIFRLEAGKLSDPLEDGGERLWMLRSEGSREPEQVRIRPADLESLQMLSTFKRAEALESVLDVEVYKQRYNLQIAR